MFLQSLGHTAHGAARAYARHEDVDLSVRIVPDLFSRRAGVHFGVGLILKLLQDNRSRMLLFQFASTTERALHALAAGRQHQCSAESLEQILTLHAHRLGHGQDQLVTLYGGHPGQSDTRVATGSLDDNGAGLQLAASLCGLDHGQCDTILDATAGVEILQLNDHACLEAF